MTRLFYYVLLSCSTLFQGVLVMKKLSLVFLLLLQFVILPQNSFIRQITSGDFDARKPFIYKDGFGGYNNFLFFELHQNNHSNIYYKKYNFLLSEFDDTVAVTSGNYQKILPAYRPTGGIIYQTNENGNWDIACIPDSEGVFGTPLILTTSSDDEIEPKYLESLAFYEPYFQDSIHVLFKRNNDIVFLSYNHNLNQFNEDVIFQADSGITYTEFIGFETDEWGSIRGSYLFAIEANSLGVKQIVRRFRAYTGNLSEKVVIKDSCDCSGLYLQYNYSYWNLFYLDTLDGEKRYYLIEDPTIVNPQTFYVDFPYSGNLSLLNNYFHFIITDGNVTHVKEFIDYFPYTYLLENDGETKVRFDISDLGIWDRDSLVQISAKNSNLAIGSMGMDNGNYLVVYTVWEDSIDGHIHLFGTVNHETLGAVEDESIANDFVLYQNYPNPFNPSTKIEYKLLQASDVKLNVVNILGEKVFEQYIGYQTAGGYKLSFDGKNLPSGVYVYSIYTNENRLSRKMMLMK